MEAHDSAYFDAQILHCNINIANIVTSATGRGLLIDWEISIESKSFRPTGTWQCMSAAVLRKPERIQTIEDDRESAVHTLTWLALRFTKHDTLERLRSHLKVYNQVDGQSNGITTGGLEKGCDFHGYMFPTFASDPLNRLLRELRKGFSFRYGDQYSADKIKQATDAIMAGILMVPTNFHLIDAYRYGYSMEALMKRNWLVEVFNKHLGSHDWPPYDSDKAVANDIT
ncbi:hypothetical protein M413DRAFT_447194 [Hebeloma cylindrosporum]|uniref:Fungal-type protein kinase domain-containing protein n=1 Tax=Hebeloma cylindrosporum TaxID=76867 RepID=A0A0C3C6N7_HEBCY|nr:hypothetical protein M413DRAFT_447194 [Hebeloma cylindrosporum h7]